MTQLAEVELQAELDALRHFVSGHTFAYAPEAFKNIESIKVRQYVLRRWFNGLKFGQVKS